MATGQAPEPEAAYRAWLFRILRNAAIDRLRNGAPAMVCLDEEPDIADHTSLRVEESLVWMVEEQGMPEPDEATWALILDYLAEHYGPTP